MLIYFLTKKEIRYEAILKTKKWAIIFILCILISYILTSIENKQYEDKNEFMSDSKEFVGIIISNPIKKEYNTRYVLKLTKVKEKTVNITVYLSMKGEENLEYGDEIFLKGEYDKPDTARNDKGFDYKNYLKSNGIVGTVEAEDAKVIYKNKGNIFQALACKVQRIIETQIRQKIKDEEHQDVLLGILLGNDEGIDNKTEEDFRKSSLSHILAVSGMHVAYIITIVDYLLNKLQIGKRRIKVITILFLSFFILLTNNTPSVRRACIMAGLGIIAILTNQKSDIINNMAISLLITLIQNPFSIFNTGLILSYSATLGIILLMPIFSKKEGKIRSIIAVSICAQIAILPISMVLFQSISFTFIFSNVIISFIIGIIIMLGFIISIPINIPILPRIVDILIFVLIAVSKFFSNIPLSHILVCPPNRIIIILYYTILVSCVYFKNLKRKTI
ncbi:MAG: ComEC family competence protein [Clostridia bacterium]|nr:ComEC family competence protein [Clostridia bacterium]